jgi:hypothetical protein
VGLLFTARSSSNRCYDYRQSVETPKHWLVDLTVSGEPLSPKQWDMPTGHPGMLSSPASSRNSGEEHAMDEQHLGLLFEQ